MSTDPVLRWLWYILGIATGMYWSAKGWSVLQSVIVFTIWFVIIELAFLPFERRAEHKRRERFEAVLQAEAERRRQWMEDYNEGWRQL